MKKFGLFLLMVMLLGVVYGGINGDAGYLLSLFITSELEMRSGSTLDCNGTLDVDGDATFLNASVSDSVTVGAGTPVWKIIKDTDLLIITGSDTFVVDSVRAK